MGVGGGGVVSVVDAEAHVPSRGSNAEAGYGVWVGVVVIVKAVQWMVKCAT